MQITTILRSNFVEVVEEDERIPSYEISWQEYKEIINSLADTNGSGPIVEKTLAKMCPNVVAISPEFFTAKSGLRTVIIDTPEIRSDLRFKSEGHVTVFPNCIFPAARVTLDFTKNSNNREDYELQFSAMRIKMRFGETLYTYPFPNVYSNGTVCWGSVSLPQYVNRKSIEGAPLYMAAFREANFNTDLMPYLGRFNGLTSYFKYLSTAEDFPYDNFT